MASIGKPLSDQLIKYKKTGGAADGAGENYEWKMLTLIFLRMLASGYEFQLASNMEAAGVFDDIVLRYRQTGQPWKVSYVQLKHRQNGKIAKVALLSLKGDFGLVKYCDSYCDIKTSEDDDITKFGNVEDPQFIVYTNARINDKETVSVSEVDSVFATGGDEGKVFSFAPDSKIYGGLCEWVDFKEKLTELRNQAAEDDEVITKVNDALSGNYSSKVVTSSKKDLLKIPTLAKLNDLLRNLKPVKNKEEYAVFLSKLKLYTKQANESQLDAMIEDELASIWKCNGHAGKHLMVHDLKQRIHTWWKKDRFYLTQDSRLWLEVVAREVEAFSNSTVEKMKNYKAEFEETSLGNCYEDLKRAEVVNVRVDSRTTASSLKVFQALKTFAKDKNVLHVNIEAFLEREDEVLAAWASRWCRVLVVDCDKKVGDVDAERISAKVAETVGRKQDKWLIVIASEKNELNSQLEKTESYKYYRDNCNLDDFTKMAKNTILSSIIAFQKSPFPLSSLVGSDEGFVNKIDLEVISQLLKGETHCGKDLDVTYKYFVTRRLKASDDSEPFVVNSVSDVAGKVVLIVAQPGMGKSTLMTHLANSAKKEDPSAWIVSLRLTDFTKHLAAVDVKSSNEVAAKIFLEKCALKPDNSLEKVLFRSMDHRLIIFIDGVDEVCPYYEKQAFTLLSSLKRLSGKFVKLCVASRPVFKTQLERSLRVKAHRLDNFSKTDQVEFSTKYGWEEIHRLQTRNVPRS